MLRKRTLTAVVAARFVSLTGTNMTTVALPWFVLATTGSTTKMGLVLACQTLPAFALGIPSGSVVAMLGARRSLVLGDALRAPLLVAVPVLHSVGALSFPTLLALVTVIGIFSVPYAAAASSLLPEIVGEDEREVARAQAALQVAIQTTGVVGPVAAGVLIPLIGAPQLLFVDGASYAVSAAIVLAAVRVGRAIPRAQRRRGVLAGVRYVFADSLLASIVTVGLVAHVGLAALFASLPALAFREFHDARSAGVLFTADAVGSIIGGARCATTRAPLQPTANRDRGLRDDVRADLAARDRNAAAARARRHVRVRHRRTVGRLADQRLDDDACAG
jgi:MFS family permease